MGGKLSCVSREKRKIKKHKKRMRKTAQGSRTKYTAQEATFEALRNDIVQPAVQEVARRVNSQTKKIHNATTNDTNIGNSIEILDCPEMSTISLENSRDIPVPRVEETNTIDGMKTPTQTAPSLCITNTAGEVTQACSLESTSESLNVPPNSLNSQYISGIVPLESMMQEESAFYDSVFHRDTTSSDSTQECVDSIHYLNNNSISLYPREYSHMDKAKFVLANSPTSDDILNNNSTLFASDGPGLDSDFGASAGIEMRIVSTDYSDHTATTDGKSGTVRRGRTYKKKVNRGRPSPRLQMASAMGILPVVDNASPSKRHPGTPIVYTPVRRIRGVNRLGKRQQRQRPATISGPEVGMQVTMEWDPFDMDYGTTHWMEYIIPGVSHPPQPLLCATQHWV